MSDVTTLDLTMYGCPLHYIKAREAVNSLALGQEIMLVVNNGDSLSQVMKSLSRDGQLCEVSLTDALTSTLRVIRKQ